MTPLQKYWLKKIGRWTGLRARGSRDRRTGLEQFCRHLREWGYEPRSIIDVGVADGTFEIYRCFPRARYLLVEPMAEFAPQLNWISRHYDAAIAPVAAGAADATTTIHFATSHAGMHGATLAVLSRDAGVYPAEREIRIRRLDALAKEHGIEPSILIKVDTQGTELDVVAGSEGILDAVDVVILEVALFTFGHDVPLLDATIRKMADYGFVPYDIFGGYNRPLDDALAQIDIAFVKRDGRFRSDNRFADPLARRSLLARIVQAVRRVLGA
jgi:FkbM family methyltransferase